MKFCHSQSILMHIRAREQKRVTQGLWFILKNCHMTSYRRIAQYVLQAVPNFFI